MVTLTIILTLLHLLRMRRKRQAAIAAGASPDSIPPVITQIILRLRRTPIPKILLFLRNRRRVL